MNAFPSPIFEHEKLGKAFHSGMMLRDYFAAKAMQSLMEKFDDSRWEIAQEAYQFADAMMEARNK